MKTHRIAPLAFDPLYYTSFPYLCHTHDGRIVVTYRQASTFSRDAALRDLTTHHDPNSWICTRIIDYNEQNIEVTSTEQKIAYRGAYGVNDPAITKLRNGGYLLRFVALNIYESKTYRPSPSKKIFSHRVEHGLVTEVFGQIVLYSNDLDNWIQHGSVTETSFPPSCARDPIIQLQDESLILPSYIGAPSRSDVSILHRSYDNGKTWSYESVIAIDQEVKIRNYMGLISMRRRLWIWGMDI